MRENVLIFLLILNSVNGFLYKRVFQLSGSMAFRFESTRSFENCSTLLHCGSLTASQAKNVTISPHKMDFIKAFQFDEENKICKIGKFPNEFLGEFANDLVSQSVAGPGIYLQQGCYFKQLPTLNFTSQFLLLNNLLFYYPSGSDDLAFLSSGLTSTSAQLGSVFPNGKPFLNGGVTLKTTNQKHDQKVRSIVNKQSNKQVAVLVACKCGFGLEFHDQPLVSRQNRTRHFFESACGNDRQ